MTYDPRGYGPLTGEWREQGGGWTTELVQRVCLRCGVVVGDPTVHEKWHGVMDK